MLPGRQIAFIAALLAVSCTKVVAPTPSAGGPGAPLHDGLGTRTRPACTESAEAQRYFDQGLAFLYAFNHDEAIRSFTQATELDPTCAMAWWGIATASGPHINLPPVSEKRAKQGWEAAQKARALASPAKPADRALIEAATKRFANPPPQDRKSLDAAYAAAMRQAWAAHPEDADVGALFAESMMNLRPWDLWKEDGTPQPGTEEVVVTLERVLAKDPYQPFANHLYIHAVEASPHPEKAVPAADRLRALQPGLGHLVHMPSHIDVRTGAWEKAIVANSAAIDADRRYRERANKKHGFYGLYMAHNRHMRAFGAMMTGQSAMAIAEIDEMLAEMPADWKVEYVGIADGYSGMAYEVLVRFGKWDEILAEPEPPATRPIARAFRLYARGVAYAAKGQTKEARIEQAKLRQARKQLPKDAVFGNNLASDLLGVADSLLEGEIAYREGKTTQGLAAMREAVRREDALRYDEPPDWIQPSRHALGAALLQSGKPAEAEAVYRADLEKLPRNGWSLYGLARSLRLQRKDDEAEVVEAQLKDVWKNADLQLTSSCLCQPGA
jgi:tetratricopeptide (TPR) repeat protein